MEKLQIKFSGYLECKMSVFNTLWINTKLPFGTFEKMLYNNNNETTKIF